MWIDSLGVVQVVRGDPGSSQFYVSLEDNLMRLFGSERIARIMDGMGHKKENISKVLLSQNLSKEHRKK